MKKFYLLALLMAFAFGSTALAQVQKGEFFFNGLNIVGFQAGTIKTSSSYGNSKSKMTQFYYGPSFIYGGVNFAGVPTINYGIAKNLSIGLFMDIFSLSEKSTDDADNDKSTETLFMAGPCARYYLVAEKKFQPFAEAKIGFGSTVSKYGNSESDKTGLSCYYLGTGGTLFFKPKVGLDISLGYGNMTTKDKDSKSDSKTTIAGILFGLGMLVGL